MFQDGFKVEEVTPLNFHEFKQYRKKTYTISFYEYPRWCVTSRYFPILCLILTAFSYLIHPPYFINSQKETCNSFTIFVLRGVGIVALLVSFFIVRKGVECYSAFLDEDDVAQDFGSFWMKRDGNHRHLLGIFHTKDGKEQCVACGGIKLLSITETIENCRYSHVITWELKRMWVHPKYRGASYRFAEKLLKLLINEVKSYSLPSDQSVKGNNRGLVMKLCLVTTNAHQAAVKFYERFGFRGYPYFSSLRFLPDRPFYLLRYELVFYAPRDTTSS